MAQMNSFNIVILGGWVGKVGEVKTGKEGSNRCFCRISLATNEVWKGRDDKSATWHNLTAFGFIAKFISKYIKPGDFVIAKGKLRSNYYDKDGEKRKWVEVHVEEIMPIRGIKERHELEEDVLADDDETEEQDENQDEEEEKDPF